MTSFWYKPSLKDRLLNAAMLRTMSNEDTNDNDEPITYQWLIDNYQSSIYTDIAFIYCGNFRWECFKDDLYKFGTRVAGSAQKWRQPQTRGELRTLLELTTPTEKPNHERTTNQNNHLWPCQRNEVADRQENL